MSKLLDIELTHLCGAERFGEDHLKSIQVAEEIKSSRCRVSILLDDYSGSLNQKEINVLFETLKQKGFNLDYCVLESKLVVIAEKILSLICKDKLSSESFRKENKEVLFLKHGDEKISLKEIKKGQERYSCALLTAAWNLCRLGVFDFPEDSFYHGNNKTSERKDIEVMSILSKKYQESEEKSLKIIKATPLKDFANCVICKFV